jgi:hypothetical protein
MSHARIAWVENGSHRYSFYFKSRSGGSVPSGVLVVENHLALFRALVVVIPSGAMAIG